WIHRSLLGLPCSEPTTTTSPASSKLTACAKSCPPLSKVRSHSLVPSGPKRATQASRVAFSMRPTATNSPLGATSTSYAAWVWPLSFISVCSHTHAHDGSPSPSPGPPSPSPSPGSPSPSPSPSPGSPSPSPAVPVVSLPLDDALESSPHAGASATTNSGQAATRQRVIAHLQ